MPKHYVRLTQPLVRDTKDGDAASRDLGRGARPGRRGVPGREGGSRPDDVRHLQLQKATNEVNFAAQKFSRAVLGSNNIDSCNRT